MRSSPGTAHPERDRDRAGWAPAIRGVVWAVACSALAVLSVVWLHTPHFDPLAWTIWGREIASPEVALSTLDGPSWKPLPVLFTTPLSLLGDAAPAAWLVIARASGLLAVVLAYRLGRRLGSPAGGVLAAVLLLVIPAWAQEVAFGGELGPLVALLLGAIDRHLDERPSQALVLGVGAGLLRTEIWPFLALYGIWAWRRRAVDRRLVAGLFLVLPVLWFVPEWVVSGNPFRAGEVARASTEGRTPEFLADPVLEVLRRAYSLLPLPVHLLAVVAVLLAVRRREWALPLLAAGSLGWVAVVDAMAVLGGYPGLA
ncbi:MAG: hypothetical protein M3N31_07670, partial [Actinomycetota bacterium]|nr:hypothetical protein [Actinomycetota bacterium]